MPGLRYGCSVTNAPEAVQPLLWLDRAKRKGYDVNLLQEILKSYLVLEGNEEELLGREQVTGIREKFPAPEHQH